MAMSNGHLNVKWPCWPRYPGFYSLETITQPRRTCSLGSLGSLDPMVNGNVQWTFECQMAMLTALSWVLLTGDYDTAQRACSLGSLCSLDPMVNGNVQWTFECQMAMLTALSWVLLTGDYHTAEENVFIGFIGFIGSNGQWQCPMDI